jgi:hypothetical protein
MEGLAVLVIALGLAFWLGMGWDWAFEPSPAARQFAIVLIACVVLYLTYRYLLRRIFVPISDSTLAVLLERRFPNLRDHLITAVDVASGHDEPVAYHPELVAETTAAADQAVSQIRAAEIFNRGPLLRVALAAATLLLSIGIFAATSRDVFGFWLERLALSEQPWPRRVHLELVGFPPDAAGRRTQKLAQDDDLELLVHALDEHYQVPDEVEIRFRLTDKANGNARRRGRDTLIRVGDSSSNQSDFQLFRYEFKHVTSDIDFDIVGGDDRVRDLHLQIVDRPELFGIELECIYPEYLGRSPRRLPVTGGMRIPEGTHLILHATSTKPLTAARVHGSKDKGERQLTLNGAASKQLAWDYGTLTADDVLTVNVTDIDEVASREPYRISLSAVKDDVPQVAVRLAGIGAAITPDAILPLAGKITDDYGLDRAWFEYKVDNNLVAERPLTCLPTG